MYRLLILALILQCSGNQESCPCIDRNDCPRAFGDGELDRKELGTMEPCEDVVTVRCCGVSVSMVQEEAFAAESRSVPTKVLLRFEEEGNSTTARPYFFKRILKRPVEGSVIMPTKQYPEEPTSTTPTLLRKRRPLRKRVFTSTTESSSVDAEPVVVTEPTMSGEPNRLLLRKRPIIKVIKKDATTTVRPTTNYQTIIRTTTTAPTNPSTVQVYSTYSKIAEKTLNAQQRFPVPPKFSFNFDFAPVASSSVSLQEMPPRRSTSTTTTTAEAPKEDEELHGSYPQEEGYDVVLNTHNRGIDFVDLHGMMQSTNMTLREESFPPESSGWVPLPHTHQTGYTVPYYEEEDAWEESRIREHTAVKKQPLQKNKKIDNTFQFPPFPNKATDYLVPTVGLTNYQSLMTTNNKPKAVAVGQSHRFKVPTEFGMTNKRPSYEEEELTEKYPQQQQQPHPQQLPSLPAFSQFPIRQQEQEKEESPPSFLHVKNVPSRQRQNITRDIGRTQVLIENGQLLHDSRFHGALQHSSPSHGEFLNPHPPLQQQPHHHRPPQQSTMEGPPHLGHFLEKNGLFIENQIRENILNRHQQQTQRLFSNRRGRSADTSGDDDQFKAPELVQTGFYPVVPYSEKDPGVIRMVLSIVGKEDGGDKKMLLF